MKRFSKLIIQCKKKRLPHLESIKKEVKMIDQNELLNYFLDGARKM